MPRSASASPASCAKHEPYPTKFEKTKDPYRALVRAVVYQQLSGKAAGTIHGRVLALFPDKDHPDPEDLLAAAPETLRGAGLSRQKIAAAEGRRAEAPRRRHPRSAQALAHERRGDHRAPHRRRAASAAGRSRCISCSRSAAPTCCPIDDLGVRKGAEKLYRRNFTPKELGAYGERWAPFRSAAAWHLWRFVDTQTPDASKI